MFKAICKLGLEGIVSKKLDSPYKSGPSKAWLKIKNPKAPAATRAIDGTLNLLLILLRSSWERGGCYEVSVSPFGIGSNRRACSSSS
jgi:ATP-dependent DNA ligase